MVMGTEEMTGLDKVGGRGAKGAIAVAVEAAGEGAFTGKRSSYCVIGPFTATVRKPGSAG